MNNLRVVIPSAGVGTRLRPHTNTIPKVLVNVAGKPILAHILDSLLKEGIDKVTFVVGYFGELVEAYILENYNIDAEFVYQDERKGLGHAIYLSKNTFKNEEVLIVLGDSIFDLNIGNFLKSDYSALGVKKVDDPKRFGVAKVRGGFVRELIEKPEKPISRDALVGLYYIKNTDLLINSLDYIINSKVLTRGEFQLTDALQWMIKKGEKFIPYSIDGWFDCGTAETLLSTNEFLLNKSAKNYKIKGSLIINPVHISKNCIIENSIIGPFTTISENSIIKNSTIKNSILGIESVVENSILTDSLIGNNSQIIGKYKKFNTGDFTLIEID